MRNWVLSAVCALALAMAAPQAAWAWGASGHSIVAEVAQHRLSPQAAAQVERLLGRGRSLASIASWADDVRDERPYSYNWHFVDIPVADSAYVVARDCHESDRGDCVLAELERLQHELRCARTDAQRAEALRFAVHFVGDLHQPLHTLLEERGGNGVQVTVLMRGATSTRDPQPQPSNLHSVWDTGLIEKTVWNWGAYVDRLEGGWLRTPEARAARGGSPLQWALAAHVEAQKIWNALPADRVLNDDYFRANQLTLDRQLGMAGLHLADYLNAAFARGCGEREAALRMRRYGRP